MSEEDPTLLALIIDDPNAPRVLAAWKSLRLPLSMLSERSTLDKIAMLAASSPANVSETLQRCTAAGLLIDEGISALANTWLSAVIGARVPQRKPKDKPKDKR